MFFVLSWWLSQEEVTDQQNFLNKLNWYFQEDAEGIKQGATTCPKKHSSISFWDVCHAIVYAEISIIWFFWSDLNQKVNGLYIKLIKWFLKSDSKNVEWREGKSTYMLKLHAVCLLMIAMFSENNNLQMV